MGGPREDPPVASDDGYHLRCGDVSATSLVCSSYYTDVFLQANRA